jgi:hypothetical protein
MHVELLYFEGCPGHDDVLPRLRVLAGDRAEIELRRIESVEDAEAHRFLGSPTVRVNGTDVDPDARDRRDFGMKCRLYRTNDGQSHAPPDDWIRRALDDAE